MSRLWTFVTVQDKTAYLSRLRYDFGALVCKDPHDRIYAVMNFLVLLERRHLRIHPDYDRPIVKVYRELVRRTIGVRGDLTILEECEASAEDDGSLPSWVPNWACQRASRGHEWGASFASAQLSGWTTSNDVLDDSSDILTLAGVSVSTIQHVEAGDPDDDINALIDTRTAQMLFQEGMWEFDRPWDVSLCEWVLTFKLLTGEVAEALSPIPQWASTMEDGVETLRVILTAGTNTPYKNTFDKATWASGMSDRFLTNAGHRVAERRMYKDSGGSLVLAPPLVRPGDLV